MRRVISACCLLFFMGTACLALQAQLSPESKAEMFSGRDPLAGAIASTPLPTSGPCVPPRSSNWTLVGQDGINCYWYAPYPQRINGYVTSINNVGAVEKLGGRCGVDAFDASKAVCQNAGDQFAGATPTKGLPLGIGTGGQPNDSTASTGNYKRQPSPPAFDPCHPYYDMGTPAGRAAAQQNAAKDQQNCNDERCKHNPQLEVCGGPHDPGAKGIKITPAPQVPSPPPPPAILVLHPGLPPSPREAALAMSKCLQAQFPNWPTQFIQDRYMQMARNELPEPDRSTPLVNLPVQSEIFLEEIAMALQSQAYHDSLYGQRQYDPNDPNALDNPANSKYYLAGWFNYCLYQAHLQTQADARPIVENLMGANYSAPKLEAYDFGGGFDKTLPPLPLLPTPSRYSIFHGR